MAFFQNYPLHQAHQMPQQLTYPHYHGYAHARHEATNPYHHWGAGNPYVHAGVAMKTESKPRLSKEEVEQLESEFQKNNKPNSSLKKGLAEQLGVDIARINNWFQNRRAKKKQMIRAAEVEASRKAEKAKSESEPSSPEMKEFFHSNEQNEALLPSKATISTPDSTADASTTIQETQDLQDAEQTATVESPEEYNSPASSISKHAENNFDFIQLGDGVYMSSGCDLESLIATSAPDMVDPVTEEMNMPTATVSCSPETNMQDFTSLSFNLMVMRSNLEDVTSFRQTEDNKAEMPMAAPETEQDIPQPSIEAGYQHASPESLTQSPRMDAPGFRFESPPAIGLASRRRRPGPAPLGIRTASHGPVTGIGFGGRQVDPGNPMPRVPSTAGHGPQGIRKIPAPPRSPFPERNRESLLRLVSSPIMMAGFNMMAPPTPETPVVATQHQQAVREATASSSSSDDGKSMLYHQSSMSSLGSVMDQNLRTPPTTPSHIPDFFPYSNLNFALSDEPLLTPGLHEGFPMSDMNVAPQYVTSGCGSQPPTPGYAPAGGMGFMAAFSEGAEYNWNTTQMASARASPGGPRRALTFNNFTAEDFSTRNK